MTQFQVKKKWSHPVFGEKFYFIKFKNFQKIEKKIEKKFFSSETGSFL